MDASGFDRYARKLAFVIVGLVAGATLIGVMIGWAL